MPYSCVLCVPCCYTSPKSWILISCRPAEESPPTSHKSVESEDEFKPYKDPYRALDDSLKSIQKDDWETKMSAINSIRRLALNHPDVLASQLHTVTIAILNEV